MPEILLVEDNDMNRDMLSRRLTRRGYQVIVAVNGEEAVQRAAGLPDLILLDMSLPLMDGWAVARHLKAQETTREIPIMALTAHAMVGDRERALDAGCDDYEAKPIDFPRLLAKMSELLAPSS
jgi:two-component system, cell cycle response regulator DivK